MNIFKKISKSVCDPEFYSKLKSEKTSLAIKYYLKFTFFVSIILAVIWSFSMMPVLKSALSPEGIKEIISLFPADLNLKIDGKQFSANVIEPYYISLPEGYSEEVSKNNHREIENLIVIDTSLASPESSASDILKQYKTISFITNDSFISETNNGLSVMSLKNNSNLDYVINKQTIENLAFKIVPTLKILFYFSPILALAVYFVFYLFNLLPLLLLALLVWLVLSFKKSHHGYWHAYRVTLHAITLGILIDVVYFALFCRSLGWCLLSVITIAVVFINVNSKNYN